METALYDLHIDRFLAHSTKTLTDTGPVGLAALILKALVRVGLVAINVGLTRFLHNNACDTPL